MRKFVFRGGGQEITLPVTPSGFTVPNGQDIQTVNIHEIGDVRIAGKPTLSSISIEGFFPSKPYPFAHYYAEPYSLVRVFLAWRDSGEVVRFLIPGTTVNLPVLIESIDYGEQDGSGDVYYTLSLSEYRYVSAPTVKTSLSASRAVDEAPKTAQSYTVQKGDTLASIARKFYGDSSMAYKLATANGIKNPNVIKVGQTLEITDDKALQSYAPTPARKAGNAGKTSTATEGKSGGGGNWVGELK